MFLSLIPFSQKYRRPVVYLEPKSMSWLLVTHSPPVPFHVNTIMGVLLKKIVTGICANSPRSDLPVSSK